MTPAQNVLAIAALDRNFALLDLVEHLSAEQSVEVAEALRPLDPQAAELIEACVAAGMIAGTVAMPTAD